MDNQKLSGKVKLAGILAASFIAFAPVVDAQAKPGKNQAPLETEKPAEQSPWQRYGNWPKADWSAFNTLRETKSPPVPAQPQLVYGPVEDGNPANGKKLVADRSKGGSCFACHIFPGASFPGNVGPDLSTIGAQGRTDWYLYNYINDPRVFNPNSMMVAWGTQKILNEQEIHDIVAYLKTLKNPAKLSDLDDPAKRPLPKPTANYLDPTENPALFELDHGKDLFNKPGPTGKSCASCHAKPEKEFKNWAATMPRWEPRIKKVLNTEEFLTRHGRATTGDDFLMESGENSALSIYVRRFALGQPINIQVKTKEEKAALKRGEELANRKIGQLNLACSECHGAGKGADHWIRGQFLPPLARLVGRHPYWRTSQGEVWTIRKRLQWCGVAIRANELPPDAPEYGDLEYYLTYISNGKKIDGPGIGH